jgi:DNA-binding CsgD family transcriptional regulator
MHLLERQDQLEALNRSFQEARRASGKLVLIAGEAGLGKSALVERFVSEHRREACTFWGACDALATPRALAPVYEIAAQTAILTGRMPREEGSRDLLFRCLLEDLARPERSCVAVLEDAHWADEATLDFLRYMGRRIQRTSAVFVVTYRDEELPVTHPVRLSLGELTGHHVVRMRLAPLSLAAVQVLAKDSGRDPAFLHRITGGNPFFVRELLSSPGERIPETVRDAVIARLMRCSPPTRELAELASVSPGRTESWLIEAVLGLQKTAVDEAGARGLLDVLTESVGFRHELARHAVASVIPAEKLRNLHQKVLQALIARGGDSARIVHHATLADDGVAVLEYAPRAADEATRLGAHREAAAHLEAAVRYSADLTTAARGGLLERHARECSLANLTLVSIESATRALGCWRSAEDPCAQARVLCALSQEYRTIGDKTKADESVATAVALLEAHPPGANLAMAYSARSLLATNRGWDREALEFGHRALAISRKVGDHATESHALCNIGAALLGKNDRAGYEFLEQSLALALEHSLEDEAARAYRTLLFYAVLIHDFERAEPLFRDGVAHCEERGILSHSAYMRSYFAPCELDRGRWTEAAALAEELLRSPDISGVQQRITLMVTLAIVRIRRNDPGAEPLLDQAMELALPTCELNRVGRVAAARAEHAWYRGDRDRVVREAAVGLRHLEGHTAPWIKGEILWWHSRVQPIGPIPADVAPPYQSMLSGDWQAAAKTWGDIGMPYEQALALAEGPEDALREALSILEQLGAGSLATVVRRRLRERGAKGVPRGPRDTTRANPQGLTSREIEVLSLLALGDSNAQLGRRLHRSTKTIDHHVSSILEKLGVRTRAEALATAYALGIVGTAKSR